MTEEKNMTEEKKTYRCDHVERVYVGDKPSFTATLVDADGKPMRVHTNKPEVCDRLKVGGVYHDDLSEPCAAPAPAPETPE